MQADSRPVSSTQSQPHPRLAEVIARHMQHEFRKPLSSFGAQPFEQAMSAWHANGGGLVIDGGCGVGLSTRRLAREFPHAFVVGIDQSAQRLSRRLRDISPPPANCITVRADLVDFWRRMALAGVRPARQYLLYPNPWPKKAQLQRRWHAHPIFPTVVGLGGYLECRSNWKIYIDEMAAALTQLTGAAVTTEPYSVRPINALTPFEHKYATSGHALWRCAVELPR